MGGSKSSSKTDPVASALAQNLFGLAKTELSDQRAFRDEFVTPFLKALGLDTGSIEQLSPIFEQIFAQDVEGINQAFGGQRSALIDQLASGGFRTGSQAAGLTALGQGQAQATVDAKRSALLNQLGALFQGANIATGNVGLFGTNLFGPALGAFSPLQKSSTSPLGSILGAAGSAAAAFCWVAESIYGTNDWRTWLLRTWITKKYADTTWGFLAGTLYRIFGRTVARLLNRFPSLKVRIKRHADRLVVRTMTEDLFSMQDRL